MAKISDVKMFRSRKHKQISERFETSRLELFNLLVAVEREATRTAASITAGDDIDHALELGFGRLVKLGLRSRIILEKLMAPYD